MSTYHAYSSLPPLVQRAVALAEQEGFRYSCLPEAGRLLSILASQVRHGMVGEIGTGTGVGAAWMLSYLDPTTRFVSVEEDAARVAIAQSLLRDQPNAHIIHGDWQKILAYAPFDLLFLDAGPAKAPASNPHGETAAEMIVSALRMGGMLVMDDLTPEEFWPVEWHGRPDPVREFWLNDVRLHALEVFTTPRTMAILATRIGG